MDTGSRPDRRNGSHALGTDGGRTEALLHVLCVLRVLCLLHALRDDALQCRTKSCEEGSSNLYMAIAVSVIVACCECSSGSASATPQSRRRIRPGAWYC
jgi:hypothetical protein